jgi:hypothetical protein
MSFIGTRYRRSLPKPALEKVVMWRMLEGFDRYKVWICRLANIKKLVKATQAVMIMYFVMGW